MPQCFLPKGTNCVTFVPPLLQAVDEASALVGLIRHGTGRMGGEAVFVPAGSNGEDDGYLVTFVYDEGSGNSELVLYDAKTMSCNPVARVKMPRRVPFGFHGLWMTGKQIHVQEHGALQQDNSANMM
jgi:carotenoid cleavage dioxygenase-like enzyme